MNQDYNQNIVPEVVPQGIPETPPAPPVQNVVPSEVVTPNVETIPMAPVQTQAVPQEVQVPVQQVVVPQAPTQDMGLTAPVGDNTGIPEMPTAPEAPVQENTVQEQVSTPEANGVPAQNNVVAEGPKVVKPNAYNVEAVIVTEEEQLINAYVGKNHQKIVHKRFNFAALFFSGVYYFYRKMTVLGLLLLLINAVLLKYFPIGLLILAILCGICTNKIYVNHVKNKVEQLQKRNMDAGLSTLLLMCEKDGGTNSSMIVVAILLSGAISFGLNKIGTEIDFDKLLGSLKDKGGEVIDKLEDEVNKFNEESILIPIGDRKYEGTMTFENEPNYSEVFNFAFPTDFYEQEFDNVAQYLYLNNYDCIIEFYQPDGYSTGESVVKQMKNYHSPNSVLKKVTSNSIHWVTFEYEDRGISHFYGTTIRNVPYILEFRVNDGDHKDACLLFKDQILSGVTIK